MANNQNQTNRTQGGGGRTTDRPTQPKTEIRVEQDMHIINDVCRFDLRVTLFSQRSPIVDQEIILEEGISMLNSGVTDIDGSVIFDIRQPLTDDEQTKTLSVRLTNTPDIKKVVLTIPAKKKPKKTTKKFRVRFISVPDVIANECYLTIEAVLSEDDLPFPLQSVILKKGVTELGRGLTDANGKITFAHIEPLGAVERNVTFRVCLENFIVEEEFTVTIPGPVPPKKTVKKFRVRVISAVDSEANECNLTIESTLTEDDAPYSNQSVILKKGLAEVDRGITDVNGKLTFSLIEKLVAVEQNLAFRVCHELSSVEEEFTATIPAAEPKVKKIVDRDPEHLELMSHHDGAGNFKAKVRITKFAGKGLATSFSIWCDGVLDSTLKTDKNGEVVFNVPGTLCEGEEKVLTASVSGIQETCKITLRRANKFVRTWLEERIRLGLLIVLGLWVLAILVGPGKPMINADVFRGKDGLSISERLYNESASIPSDFKYEATSNFWQKSLDFIHKFIWLIALLFTIFVLAVIIGFIVRSITLRSEEALEEILHRSVVRASDPNFEQIAKYFGSYHSVRRSRPAVQVTQVGAPTGVPATGTVVQPAQPVLPAMGLKGSIMTFLTLDLLVEMVLAILRKMFKK